MTSMIQWLQAVCYIVQILMAVGASLFTIFVLWPSIRLQERFIRAQEKKGIDDLIEKL